MKIFITGGCKNGKSHLAQHLAKEQQVMTKQNAMLYYIATMIPTDSEDINRINQHKKERAGLGFSTIEQPYCIEDILDKCDVTSSILLDSMTALLANEMFLPNGTVNFNADDKIINGFDKIAEKIDNIVVVSDYIYSDAMLYSSYTKQYQKALAKIDKRVVKVCDVVIEMLSSHIMIHKGKETFHKCYEAISERIVHVM